MSKLVSHCHLGSESRSTKMVAFHSQENIWISNSIILNPANYIRCCHIGYFWTSIMDSIFILSLVLCSMTLSELCVTFVRNLKSSVLQTFSLSITCKKPKKKTKGNKSVGSRSGYRNRFVQLLVERPTHRDIEHLKIRSNTYFD